MVASNCSGMRRILCIDIKWESGDVEIIAQIKIWGEEQKLSLTGFKKGKNKKGISTLTSLFPPRALVPVESPMR